MFSNIQNQLYKLIGISDYTNKYVPITTNLQWQTYQNIADNNEIISKIIQGRQSIVGLAGWDVEVSVSKTEKVNQKVSKQIYELLENLNIEKIKNDFVYIMSVYNNAFLILNEDNRPIIHDPSRFNVYWDNINQKHYKINMIVNGAEQDYNYKHGEDIIHVMGERNAHLGIATPDIDTVYGWVLLYDSAIKSNKTLIESGNVGAMVAIFEKEMEQQLAEIDRNGKTKGENWLKSFIDKISGHNPNIGAQQTNKIAFLAGLKEFKDISKNNNEMQLKELLDRAEKAIYNGFGETKTDDSSTYSNSQTFKYEKHENVGKKFEKQFEILVNKFILPKLGIQTSENIYFTFNSPENPDKLAHIELELKTLQVLSTFTDNLEFKTKIINDFYDVKNLSHIDSKLLENQVQEIITIEPKQEEKEVENKNLTFAEKKKLKRFIAVDEILKSQDWETTKANNNLKKEKKGIKWSMINALQKQVKNWSEKAKNYKSVDEILLNIDNDFKKLETFYSINTLKKDLLKFADIGINEAEKTIKKIEAIKNKQKTKFAQSDEYKQAILDAVDYQATLILKETKNPAGDLIDVDNTSRNILKSIIIDYTADEFTDLELADIISKIVLTFNKKVENRAKTILIPTLSSVVEESRFITYKDKNYKYKKTEHVNDDRVISISKMAEAKGIVKIDFEYQTLWGYKKASLPLHPNDRDTMTFGESKEDFAIYG